MKTFQLVDVFGDLPFSGNPLAVVADAGALSTEDMQTITRWLNLSETTFLLPPTTPEADYRVRIFTLDREMPFAGHPTLGSCHAWLTAGGKSRQENEIVQECNVGLVPIRRSGERLAFRAPPLLRSGPVEAAEVREVARVLRIGTDEIIEAQWVDNGPGWMAVLLKSAEHVLKLEPVTDYPMRLDLGVVGFYPAGHPMAYEVRAFFSAHVGALREDPVTGSLNASVAQWLISSGRVKTPYVASQGTRLSCTGRIYVEQDKQGEIWIGGKTLTLFAGSRSTF